MSRRLRAATVLAVVCAQAAPAAASTATGSSARASAATRTSATLAPPTTPATPATQSSATKPSATQPSATQPSATELTTHSTDAATSTTSAPADPGAAQPHESVGGTLGLYHSDSAFFSPDGDGVDDTYDVYLGSGVAQALSGTIAVSTGGRTVHSWTVAPSPDNYSYIDRTWEGKGLANAGDTAETTLPAGQYTITAALHDDIGGGSQTTSWPVTISFSRPKPVLSVPAGTVVHPGDTLAVGQGSGDAFTSAELVADADADGYGSYLGYGSVAAPGPISVPVDLSTVPTKGNHPVVVEVTWFDGYNHFHIGFSAPVTLDLEPTFSIAITTPSGYVYRHDTSSPDHGTDTLTLGYHLGFGGTLGVTATPSAGGTPCIVSADHAVSGGYGELAWDGTCDGNPLPAGTYMLHVSGHDADGATDATTLPVGITDEASPYASITAPDISGTVALTSSDSITVTAAPGHLLASAEVYLTDGYPQWVGSTYVGGAGQSSLTIPLGQLQSFSEGTHHLRVDYAVVDALGTHTSYLPAFTATTSHVALGIAFDPTTPLSLTLGGGPHTVLAGFAVTTATSVDADVVAADKATVVQTIYNGAFYSAGDEPAISWDGSTTSGPAATGTYYLHVHAHDGTGHTADDYREVDVTALDAGTFTVPAGPLTGTVSLTYSPPADWEPLYATVYSDGLAVFSLSPYTSPAWTGDWDTTGVDSGSHQLTLQVQGPGGADDIRITPAVTRTVTNPVHITGVYGGSTPFDPHDPYTGPTSVSVYLSETADVTLTVTPAAGGAAVRTITTPAAGRYGGTVDWDGRDGNGAVVPDGNYLIHVHAHDPASGTSDDWATDVPVTVKTDDEPGTITAPAAGATVGDTAALTFTPRAGVTPAYVDFRVQRFTKLAAAVQQDGTWVSAACDNSTNVCTPADADLSSLVDGTYQLFATVSWQEADGSGGTTYRYAGTPAISITVQHGLVVTAIDPPAAFTPDGDSQDDTVTTSYTLARAVPHLGITVRDAGNAVVKTLAGDHSEDAGVHQVTWDGRNTAGNVVAPGHYTLDVHTTNAQDEAADATRELAVITVAPGTVAGPSGLVHGETTLTYVPASGLAVHGNVSFYDTTGGGLSYLGGLTHPAVDGTWPLAVDTSQQVPSTFGLLPLQNGPHTIVVQTQWTDEYGHQHDYTTAPVTIAVENPPTILQSRTVGEIAPSTPGGPLVAWTTTVKTSMRTHLTAKVYAGSSPASDAVPVRTITAPDIDTSLSGSLSWDGKDDGGTLLPDGAYTVKITVTDPVYSDTDTVSARVGIHHADPASVSAPAVGSTVSGPLTVTVQLPSGIKADDVQILNDHSNEVGHVTLGTPSAGPIDVPVSSADIGDGSHTISVYVRWADVASPNQLSTFAIPLPLVVANTAAISDLCCQAVIVPGSPNSDGYVRTAFATPASGFTLATVVTDDADHVVATLPVQTSVGPNLTGCATGGDGKKMCDHVVWNGTSDGSTPVPDGAYTLTITATAANGTSASASLPVTVLGQHPTTIAAPGAGAVVSDTLPVTVTEAAGFPYVPTSVEVGIVGRTALQDLTRTAATHTWTGTVDLPASIIGDLDLQVRTHWTDGLGTAHLYTSDVAVSTDETTLRLLDEAPDTGKTAPMGETFHLHVPGTGPSPVHYVIDPGDGSAPLEGDIADADRADASIPYLYTHEGTFHPTVVVTDAADHRRHDTFEDVTVLTAPPVVTESVTPDHGTFSAGHPLHVTATFAATQANNDPMTLSVDWGDGTVEPLPAGATSAEHDYATASPAVPSPDALGFPVRVIATANGVAGRGLARVKVSELVAPQAITSVGTSPLTTVDGQAEHFSASGSVPSGNVTASWHFPDTGTDVPSAETDHSFTTPGTYDVVLTVTGPDGRTAQADEIVNVLDKATASHTTVTVNGAPEADVYWTGADGKTAHQLIHGSGVIYGLPEGKTQLDVASTGFVPNTATATVTGGTGTATVTLVAGDPGTVTTAVSQVSADEAAAYGVDLDQNKKQILLTAHIAFQSLDDKPGPQLTFRGIDGTDGLEGDPKWDLDNDECHVSPSHPNVVHCYQGGPGGGPMQVAQVQDGPGNQPQIITMTMPITGSVEKEFFQVSGQVTNAAPAGSHFTWDAGKATISFGSGLGLAVMKGQQQSPTITFTDPIAPQGSAAFSWMLVGNDKGDWPVMVTYTSRDQLTNQPISLSSPTGDDAPIAHVLDPTQALTYHIQVPESVTKDQPAHFRIGLENNPDYPPAYNVETTLQEEPDKYVFGPGTDEHGTDHSDGVNVWPVVLPGKTVWADYWLIPTFTGTFDRDQTKTYVDARTKGEAPDKPDVIEPLTPDYDPQHPPTVTVGSAGADGNTPVSWSPVDGASSYNVYVADDLLHGFTAPIYSGSSTSVSLATPDTYDQPGDGGGGLDSYTPLQRRTAYETAAAPADAAATGKARDVIVQTVTDHGTELIHPVKEAAATYLCPGSAGAPDPVSGLWKMLACVNPQVSSGQVTGWLAQAGQTVDLNGLQIVPSGSSTRILLDKANNLLSVTGPAAIKLANDGLAQAQTLITSTKSFSLDLTKPVTFTLPNAAKVLGLPIEPGSSVTITPGDGNIAKLAFVVRVPATLGGGTATLDATTASGSLLDLSSLKVTFDHISLGGVVKGSGHLLFDTNDAGGSSWHFDGTVAGLGSATAALTGTWTSNADGSLKKIDVKASNVPLGGLVALDSFELSNNDGTGTGWTGAGTAHAAGGAVVNVAGTYTVNTTTNKITTASVTAPQVSVPHLFSLTNFAMTYVANPASWTLSGQVKQDAASAATPATFTGTLNLDTDGGISTGNVRLTHLPIAGFMTTDLLVLDYAAADQSYKGDVAITLPNAPSPVTGHVEVVGGVLKKLTVDHVDAAIAGLFSLQDGSLAYDSDAQTFSVSGGQTTFATLLQLDSFSFASKNDTGDGAAEYQVTAAGHGLSIDADLSFDTGALAAGTANLHGLDLGGLLDVPDVALSYTKATQSWAASGGGGSGLTFDVSASAGKLSHAKLVAPHTTIAGAVDVSATVEYGAQDAATSWKANGTVTTPGSSSEAFGFTLTTDQGKVTGGTLTGSLVTFGGLGVQVQDVGYTAGTDTWAGTVKVKLPVGGGAAAPQIDGTFKVHSGHLDELKATIDSTNVPVGGGVFLSGASFAVTLPSSDSGQFSFSGSATLTAGPQVAGASLAKLVTTVGYTSSSPTSGTYTASGALALANIDVGTGTVTYDTRTGARLHVTFGLGVAPIARMDATLDGALTADDVHLTGAVTFQLVFQTLTGQVGASNKGLTACASLSGAYTWVAGIGYAWGDSAPKGLDGSCDLTALKDIPPPATPPAGGGTGAQPHARAHAVPATTFTVAAGEPVHELAVTAAEAAPALTLTAPDGTTSYTVDPASAPGAQDGGKVYVLADPGAKTTYALIDAPAAGDWTYALTSGGAVTGAATATGLPAPDVAAVLDGTTSRTLTWTFPERVGQTVRFVEDDTHGNEQELATDDVGEGHVTFTPLATDGAHTIRAVIVQDGFVRKVQQLLQFTGTGQATLLGDNQSPTPTTPVTPTPTPTSPTPSPKPTPKPTTVPTVVPAPTGLLHVVAPQAVTATASRSGHRVLQPGTKGLPKAHVQSVLLLVHVGGKGGAVKLGPAGPGARTTVAAGATKVVRVAMSAGGITASGPNGLPVQVWVLGWYGDSTVHGGLQLAAMHAPARTVTGTRTVALGLASARVVLAKVTVTGKGTATFTTPGQPGAVKVTGSAHGVTVVLPLRTDLLGNVKVSAAKGTTVRIVPQQATTLR
ncbi:MAG TPA: FlgD immunoglobulin-like domain containing protein [Mycobacteriales bacterium]|nr:FlgD immunoglobulin-like domain containing protein [Mycobacteriales bacterium]